MQVKRNDSNKSRQDLRGIRRLNFASNEVAVRDDSETDSVDALALTMHQANKI